FSSRRRHTRSDRDWSSDVCSSDLPEPAHEVDALVGPLVADAEHGPEDALLEEGDVERAAGIAAVDRRLGQLEAIPAALQIEAERSEERRVGKECRSRWEQ